MSGRRTVLETNCPPTGQFAYRTLVYLTVRPRILVYQTVSPRILVYVPQTLVYLTVRPRTLVYLTVILRAVHLPDSSPPDSPSTGPFA